MIARGKSPGTAASNAIDRLELATDRASIVMIPANREAEFEPFSNRLLDEKASRELMISLDIQAVSG